ncbi:uncharacterized protein LOC129238603 isoform X2 [Anastrepha obliqua]|uniref:uncharacterized protein LOC129238603 isoform X2 n=1 Tax=Anastrepha obliqua TaxID=95512 RepID=UPI002409DFEB|nr:uncharacterized protein LOC129238603 isoform X2 [Anastrepha obliqua]
MASNQKRKPKTGAERQPQCSNAPAITRTKKNNAQVCREYRARKKTARENPDSDLHELNTVDMAECTSSENNAQRVVSESSLIVDADSHHIQQSSVANATRTSSTHRVRAYRARQRALIESTAGPSSVSVDDLIDPEQPYSGYKRNKSAHQTFDKQFYGNTFGHKCSVCDRLWFQNDLNKPIESFTNILNTILPGVDIENILLCRTCRRSFTKNLDEIQEAPIQQPRTTNGIDGIREAPIRRTRTPHGIDEIQDAPVQNARTTHTNHANRNNWDNEVDDRSNAIRTQKKCKDILKHDAETEIVLEPEADIEIQKEIVPPTVGSALPERPGFSSGQGLSLRHMYGNVINVNTTTTTIKKEIDCFDDDDINKVTAICEDISDEDSKPDAILDFEAEMYMKTEIELANDEYTTSELNTPTSLINVPTLGFPVTTMLASGEAGRATTSDKSKKSVEEACKKRKIALLPCPSDITNASDVGHIERRVFTISPPSTSLNISTQATVDTAKAEKIVLSHPSPTTAKEVTGTESFNTKHSTHTSVPEDTTNGSKKRKITSLNEMYETVLKSINKRDEREEQIMGILQGLAVAVTRLSDNVQRLEEVLTFCKNN